MKGEKPGKKKGATTRFVLAIGGDVGFCCRRKAVRKTVSGGGMSFFSESNTEPEGIPTLDVPKNLGLRLCGPAQIRDRCRRQLARYRACWIGWNDNVVYLCYSAAGTCHGVVNISRGCPLAAGIVILRTEVVP